MLIDTHAHLNDERLLGRAEEIVSGMAAANLAAIVNVGYDRASSESAFALSNKYEKLYAVLGIHPHDARLAATDDYDYIKNVANNPKVVAIGETGLDFFYDRSDRDTQKRVFIEHLELASSLKLPVVIHMRDAYEETYRILQDHKALLHYGAVMHCYMGSLEMLKRFCAFDTLYYSYGGAITFKNAKKEDVVKATPLDRLLLETDCPYMSPVPHRSKDNEPKYIHFVKDKIQESMPDVDIASVTTANALSLFKRIKI